MLSYCYIMQMLDLYPTVNFKCTDTNRFRLLLVPSRFSVGRTAMCRLSANARTAACASSTRRTGRRARPADCASASWWACPRAAPATAAAPIGSKSIASFRSRLEWTRHWVAPAWEEVAATIRISACSTITVWPAVAAVQRATTSKRNPDTRTTITTTCRHPRPSLPAAVIHRWTTMTTAPLPRKTYACCSVEVRRNRSTSFTTTTTTNGARPLPSRKVGSWPSPDCPLVYRRTIRRRRWQPSTPSGPAVRNFRVIHPAVLAGDGIWSIRVTSTLWLPGNTSIRTTGRRHRPQISGGVRLLPSARWIPSRNKTARSTCRARPPHRRLHPHLSASSPCATYGPRSSQSWTTTNTKAATWWCNEKATREPRWISPPKDRRRICPARAGLHLPAFLL